MHAAPFDITRFHTLRRTKSLGRNLIFEPSVGSTMDVARDGALHGAPEGTVALADEQTAGRGRLGRSWITPPATNIAATLLLRPPASVLRDISMIAPLAVCHAVQDIAGIRADIKWPNDVQIGGKKLAGILIETDLTAPHGGFVLVGSGINVNFDPRDHAEIRDIATSLKAELGRDIDRESLLAAYLAHFEQLYTAAKSGESTRDRWRERLVTLGNDVRATWQGGSAEGIAEDVDDDGALLVRTADGALTRVEAGDVTLRM
jgi:BirA family transcriptional regulator, biotin operon repressor / biotin---[acetyl-CoA-carboxylase] ligase